MISLTRLSGTAFLLNADLIERVDRTPDTVVTLVDGTKYLVSESLDEVLAAVVHYRSSIVARASLPDATTLPTVGGTTPRPTRLSAVPAADRVRGDDHDDHGDHDRATDRVAVDRPRGGAS